MKGRKATPNKIVKLMGGSAHTHRKEREDTIEPPSKIPTCPAHLDTKARNEWYRVVKILGEIGILTELDRSVLAAYCEAYSTWVNAIINIRKLGGEVYFVGREIEVNAEDETKILKAGIPKINPYVRVKKEAEDQMRKNGQLLGFSPSSRASLSIASTNPKEKDPYEEFLAREAKN